MRPSYRAFSSAEVIQLPESEPEKQPNIARKYLSVSELGVISLPLVELG